MFWAFSIDLSSFYILVETGGINKKVINSIGNGSNMENLKLKQIIMPGRVKRDIEHYK